MPNSKEKADKTSGSAPKLLTGGNPQIPKGEGDGPVQAYISAMPGSKRSLGERLDRLTTRASCSTRSPTAVSRSWRWSGARDR